MSHRELFLSTRKKFNSRFLALPPDLQDEIMERLDNQSLTLSSAVELVKSRGYRLSYSTLQRYCSVVRSERRFLELNQELRRVISEFAAMPQEEASKALVNLVIATAASGVLDGSVGVRKIDLSQMLKAAGVFRGTSGKKGQEQSAAPAGEKKGLSPETIEAMRKRILEGSS